MKRWLFVMLCAVVSASALANPELAKQKNCMSCHALDARLVGPAYRDVAKKYAGQADAEDKLVQKVLKGGGGVWGVMVMPPNSQVSVAEAHVLVKWILSLK